MGSFLHHSWINLASFLAYVSRNFSILPARYFSVLSPVQGAAALVPCLAAKSPRLREAYGNQHGESLHLDVDSIAPLVDVRSQVTKTRTQPLMSHQALPRESIGPNKVCLLGPLKRSSGFSVNLGHLPCNLLHLATSLIISLTRSISRSPLGSNPCSTICLRQVPMAPLQPK